MALDFDQADIARIANQGKRFHFGISYLDDALGAFMPYDFVVIGARTGRGKTALALHLALNAAAQQRRVVFYALEARRFEVEQRLLYGEIIRVGRELYPSMSGRLPRYRGWLMGELNRVDGEDFARMLTDEAKENLRKKTAFFDLRYLGFTQDPTKFAVGLVRDIEANASHDSADLVVLDHLHYFAVSHGTETEAVQVAIHKFNEIVVKHNVPMLVVSHLRKGSSSFGATASRLPSVDDFHGHSDIVKVATTVVTLAPQIEDATAEKFITLFQVLKAREAGEVTPYVARHSFITAKNAYSREYTLLSSVPDANGAMTLEVPKRIPSWARHHVDAREGA